MRVLRRGGLTLIINYMQMKRQKNTEPLRNIIIITLISFYVLIVVISAWLSDDAYITFRTVDNFINGFGLTWCK